MRKQWLSALAAAAVSSMPGLAGCGTDLGECDETMLGGSEDPNMPVPHTAQGLVNGSCAAGLCHSASAEGDARRGAPGELNFDVLPANTSFEEISKVQDGAAVVQDRAEDMWALIDSGEMPPPMPEGGGEMSAPNKEIVRNWLACGAPVIATPAASMHDDAFSEIYTALSGMNCQGCHQEGRGMGSFLPMPGNPCQAYDMLVGAMASGPECGDDPEVLVQAGMPQNSLLVKKLRGTQTCGSSMPMGEPPLATTNEPLVLMIEAWIMDGALEPSGCR